MLREGNVLAKTSQTPPDLPCHGDQLHLEHRPLITNIRGIFSPIFPPFCGVSYLPGQKPRLLQASPLGYSLQRAAPLRSSGSGVYLRAALHPSGPQGLWAGAALRKQAALPCL